MCDLFEFSYLKSDDLEKYAGDLVSILYDNMEKIVPTGNSCEVVFQHWFPVMREELQSGTGKTILIFKKDTWEIVGYLRYKIRDDVYFIVEIQIKAAYQGKYHVFRKLYGFLLEQLGTDIAYVEAYVNKCNEKSLGVHRKLGLSIIGENLRGTSYHMRGTYSDLLKWYHGKED